MPMTSMEGMDEGLYGDDAGSEKTGDNHESIDEQESMHPTALLDMKILTGKDGAKPKVGEERVLKIVAIHDDQAEVEYAPEKPSETDSETDNKSSDKDLEQMNSDY